MPFKKGQSGNKGGRTKGTPNKLTATAKEAFQLAFDELGGVERMVKWAKEDPDHLKTFYSLYSKLIPMDVTSKGEGLTLTIVRAANGEAEQQAG